MSISDLYLEGMSSLKENTGSKEVTKYGYIGLYVLVLMICLPLFAFHLLLLIKECRNSLKDVFRIIQIVILLEYLLMIIIIDGLRFLEDYWFGKRFLFFFGMIGYFLSDLINITCWALLLIHTKYYTNSLSKNSSEGLRNEMESIIQKIKKREKFILFSLVAFIIIFTVISLWALPFGISCNECSHGSEDEWEEKCKIIYKSSKIISKSFSVFGMIVSVFKIVLGGFVLYLLKNHLNFYYRVKRKGIILAVLLTGVSNTIKLITSFRTQINNASLKVKFTDGKGMEVNELWYSLILAFLLRVLPIIVIVINIQVIYYTCYLRNLMKGGGIGDYLKVCSIFMKSSKNIYEILDEDQKDSFGNKNSTLIGDEDNLWNHSCSQRQTSYCKNNEER